MPAAGRLLAGVAVSGLAVAVCGALAIWGHTGDRRPRALVYVFKPLTTVLILVLAATSAAPSGHRYEWAIVAGLAFSLAGDVFLMLPRERFRAGLASFLLAHVCYLTSFTAGVPFADPALPLLLWAAAGAGIARLLWRGIEPGLRLPVLVYVGFLVAMTAQATSRALLLRTAPALAACVGATLFAVSDTLLAVDRFRYPFRFARALVLATYYAAQWLIAVSAVPIEGG